MFCIPCAIRLHDECFKPKATDNGESNCCCWSEDRQDVSVGESSSVLVIGGRKENGEVTDATSTGRKRAAKLKPIIEGMVCEWAGLLYAGGGAVPIIGCDGVRLTAQKGQEERTGNVHHGPDKSTLNNADENLHRVCGRCHNRWHTLNDPLYAKERPENGDPYLPLEGECRPHDKHTLATDEDIAYHETWWKLPKEARAALPYRKDDDDRAAV